MTGVDTYTAFVVYLAVLATLALLLTVLDDDD